MSIWCILISFVHNCTRNNEIQSAGQLQPKGCCYCLKVPSGQSEVSYLLFIVIKIKPSCNMLLQFHTNP